MKKSLSSRVSVSALAMTGTMFTTLLRRRMNSTSSGRRLGRGRERKGEGAAEKEREGERGRHREIAEETQGERQAHRHDFNTYTRVF